MYNRLMPSGLSWEVLRRHARLGLSRSPGWIIAGLAGPLLLTIWLLVRPFDIRAVVANLLETSTLLIAWYAAFTTLWAVFHWLRPAGAGQEGGLDAAPLSALQYFLHRCAGLCTVPLLAMALTLPLFLIMLANTGDPYGSGSGEMAYMWRANWEWAQLPNPWGWRMFFTALNLAAATLIPLAMAVMLQETVRWATVRIILQIAFPPVLWYIVRCAEYDFVRICYRQTRGHDLWGYLLVGAVLVAVPFLLGWLKHRGRLAAGAVLLALVAAIALLPLLAGAGSAAAGWLAPVRDALGDARFALGYFAGHLQPALNVEMIFHSYPSSVLLDDNAAGNLIPRRVALWVGAGLYPVLLPIASFILLGLGISLSKRHPTE